MKAILDELESIAPVWARAFKKKGPVESVGKKRDISDPQTCVVGEAWKGELYGIRCIPCFNASMRLYKVVTDGEGEDYLWEEYGKVGSFKQELRKFVTHFKKVHKKK